MDNSKASSSARNALNVVTNQPARKPSAPADPLAKVRSLPFPKPNLAQHLTRANPLQVSSGLKILSTRIQSADDPSYQPLVTISDSDNSEEDNFTSPIHKLTQRELREELTEFRPNGSSARPGTIHALLANNNNDDGDDDAGELQFRSHQPLQRCICCYRFPFSSREGKCTIS